MSVLGRHVFCALIGLAAAYPTVLSQSGAALGQSIAINCANYEPVSEDFLSCVERALESAKRGTSARQAVLSDPVRGLLEILTKSQGYRGDLKRLKDQSEELKNDPRTNRDAIFILDNAIASHENEIRSAVSARSIAIQRDKLGVDIYSDFIKQKLAFLDSYSAKFYDKGPFELIRRSLLGTALEQSFFLESDDQKPDTSKLKRTVGIIDEILARYTEPNFSYLADGQERLHINSNLFWKASILFALGQKEDAIQILTDLATKNDKFEMQTAGYVYVYRVFNLPYRMVVRAGARADGSPDVQVDDPGRVERFYDPAQLALTVCAHMEAAGLAGVPEFANAVDTLVSADYYVVAGTARSDGELQELASSTSAILEDQLRSRRDDLLKRVDVQTKELGEEMRKGAQLCRIKEDIVDGMYGPFQFVPKIKRSEDKASKLSYLLYGGHLTATQAKLISGFLSRVVFDVPSLLQLRNRLGITDVPYIARIGIGQGELERSN